MKVVTKIDRKKPLLPARKKVAAYARVSAESDRSTHSLSTQISFYSSLIQRNPEWEYAGVYADNYISGTTIERRAEFKRMLADCDAGKIDIILTKSISRFARNTVDLLETVRHLKERGIEIRFEKERISSFNDGEFIITVLASFAQEESRSISENCKWGIRKRFKTGEIRSANKHILGYRYDDEQNKYIIIPEEAAIIRWVFQMYLERKPIRIICKALNEAGYTTINGCQFAESSMAHLVRNEIYAGDLLRQKSFTEDPITKNKVMNRGQLPKYYMPDTHEAILDRDTYAKVQVEIERRTALLNPTYPFTKKIICGCCGTQFTRKKSKVKGHTYVRWICRRKKEVGMTCNSLTFTEDELERASAAIMGTDGFDAAEFETRVKKMVILPHGDIEFHLSDNRTEVWKNLRLNETKHAHTITDAFQGRIHCGICGSSFHRVNAAERWVYWYCIGKKQKTPLCANSNYPDYRLRRIAAHVLGMDDLDEQAFIQQVKDIRVFADEKLEFHFTDGRIVTWEKA